MSYTLPHMMRPRTGTPSSPFPESVFQRAEQPCEDRRPQLSGTLAEPRPFTGYEPKQLAEDRDYKRFTGDGQFSQTLVLPPVDHCINLWLSEKHRDAPGIGLRRWATSCSAGFTTVLIGARSKSRTIASLSLWTRKLGVQFSSQDPISTGKLVALFSTQNRFNPDTFSDRDDFPSDINRFLGARTFHQILSGKCCKISSWWKQRSFACWREIWTCEAGIQSGISEHLH